MRDANRVFVFRGVTVYTAVCVKWLESVTECVRSGARVKVLRDDKLFVTDDVIEGEEELVDETV